MPRPKVFDMTFEKLYPMYVDKAVRKGRTKEEVDQVISWLTGYSHEEIQSHLDHKTLTGDFIDNCQLNPNSDLIKGTVCGVRVENVEDPTMRRLRYLDKLIDELAKGKSMDKILRKE